MDDRAPTPWRSPFEALRLLAVAFQFLTRIPVPPIPVVEGDLRRASGAFPLVGVVVAAVGIAVRAAGEPFWGAVAGTVAAVVAMVAVTGAFHEDGLADSVDGLWGGWTAEQRLEIMRDSRIGTYGTVALVASLALRVALLAPLDLVAFAAAVLVGHVLGRASILVLAALLPAARDQGSGAGVAGVAPPLAVAAALVTVGVVLGVTLGAWAFVPLLAGLAALAACRRLVRRRIGGLVGDVLGATNQVVHVTAIAAVSALAQGGVL